MRVLYYSIRLGAYATMKISTIRCLSTLDNGITAKYRFLLAVPIRVPETGEPRIP